MHDDQEKAKELKMLYRFHIRHKCGIQILDINSFIKNHNFCNFVDQIDRVAQMYRYYPNTSSSLKRKQTIKISFRKQLFCEIS